MAKPVKRFSTIDEQINVLTSRGLALDHAVADQWLRNVGYYRLSGYWYPYREIDDQPGGRRLDHFIAGASFDDVVRLYEFDRKLRTLLHDGIERVEVTLRSHLSYLIGTLGLDRGQHHALRHARHRRECDGSLGEITAEQVVHRLEQRCLGLAKWTRVDSNHMSGSASSGSKPCGNWRGGVSGRRVPRLIPASPGW